MAVCHEIHGGTCNNKVSRANGYVCAAGHPKTPTSTKPQLPHPAMSGAQSQMKNFMFSVVSNDPIPTPPAQDFRQRLAEITDDSSLEGKAALVAISREKDIDEETQMLLLNKDLPELAINGLASNRSITPNSQRALLEVSKNDTPIYLLSQNPSLDKNVAIELAKKGFIPNGLFNIANLEEIWAKKEILEEPYANIGLALLYRARDLINSQAVDKRSLRVKLLISLAIRNIQKAVDADDSFLEKRDMALGQLARIYANDEEMLYLMEDEM